jgi:hypothetical protein
VPFTSRVPILRARFRYGNVNAVVTKKWANGRNRRARHAINS